MNDVVSRLRSTFRSGRTRPLEWRDQQLVALAAMLSENTEAWEAALAADLGKPAGEAFVTEIGEILGEIDHMRRNMAEWVRTKRVASPLWLQPVRSSVRMDPLGVVVVIAPWNYPVQLQLSPLVGALAAGNCVVLKPSEVASATEALFADLVPRYVDPDAVAVVTGGADETTALIDARPDKVFFTGSTAVGRMVAERCAPLLVPYTLELGGKSPVYVHDDVDVEAAARRIAWGKFLNAGQTCVSPDHVWAHESVASELADSVVAAASEWFGPDPLTSPAYGRIINARNVRRIAGLLPDDPSQVLCGGTWDEDARFVAPTVLYPARPDDAAMREEIFGPVLPILPVSGPDEAADRMLDMPTPLAMYVFAEDEGVRERLLDRVPSGGVGIGATIVHLSNPDLPFGGLGASGQGRYHGQWSIDTFTHQRAVLDKPLVPDTLKLIYPPIGRTAEAIVRRLFGGRRR